MHREGERTSQALQRWRGAQRGSLGELAAASVGRTVHAPRALEGGRARTVGADTVLVYCSVCSSSKGPPACQALPTLVSSGARGVPAVFPAICAVAPPESHTQLGAAYGHGSHLAVAMQQLTAPEKVRSMPRCFGLFDPSVAAKHLQNSRGICRHPLPFFLLMNSWSTSSRLRRRFVRLRDRSSRPVGRWNGIRGY
jgi:hypothetical protein